MGEALNVSGKHAERTAVRLAFCLCAIVAAHYLFFFADWYASYYVFDMVMHAAAGAWLGAFGMYYFFVSGRVRVSSAPYGVLLVMGFAALVGVLWEFHEFVFDPFITDPARIMQTSVADTMGDLFFDLLGASMTLTAPYRRFPWNSHSS